MSRILKDDPWALSLRPELLHGTIHVWLWRTPDTPPSQRELLLLDEQEQKRAARFRIAQYRARWVRAHTGMRRILGHYLGLPPAQISFRRDARGKPHLDTGTGHPVPLTFNLSHSEDWCGLAVASGIEIGLDIQVRRPVDARLWRRVLTPAEQAEMDALPHDEQESAFFRSWTRREALGKAEGRGVYPHLRRTHIGLARQPGTFAVAAKSEDGTTRCWHLLDLPLSSNDGLFGAVAAAQPSGLLMRSLAHSEVMA